MSKENPEFVRVHPADPIKYKLLPAGFSFLEIQGGKLQTTFSSVAGHISGKENSLVFLRNLKS